ncbi:MAG TPA: endonuclease/exonuclease/phosphatase family protein [Gammaproteobacteria bacterium]
MRRAAVVLAALIALVAPLPAELATLASWNIRHLGHGEHKSFPLLGEVVRAGEFDFLAVQEAMTDDGVEKLRAAIEHATGARWEAMSSHDIGRSTYKEKYAFLWNTDVIEYVDGAVVYLDVTDRFAREPYSARFRIRESGETFVAATVHILHGRRDSDRTPEVEALAEYWRWLQEVYADDAARILLAGDFNLRPAHPAWAALRAHAEPVIVDGATTLSSIDGRFANLYDNIFVPLDRDLRVVAAGILAFPAVLGLTHEDARLRVSDHAPVFITLEDAPPRAHRAKADGAAAHP